MSDPIEMICTLSGCPREDAERVYAETGNVVDSVDKLMVVVTPAYQKYIPVGIKKALTEEQVTVSNIREFMKNNIDTRSTCGDPPEQPVQGETQIRHEETVLQNNYSQKCQLPSLQEEVETRGTVCQSQCECSCDLQCCGRT
jgi:hypothetical protein